MMNPGPVEEGGKAIAVVGDVMKSQPLAFGILVVNVLWIAFFTYFALSLKGRNEDERKYFKAEITECRQELKAHQ